jgi:DNA primase small subunit
MSVEDSLRFVRGQFAKHYTEAPLPMPERFARREFGFMFFDRKFMMRHVGFPSRAALKKYLVEQVPAHAYYSCAYYQDPSAPTMKEKTWLGADLLFDLDADHVEGTQNLTYEQMLARVKTEVIRLIDEFLLGDLGFQEEDLKMVFSGGRGYHVHIGDPKVIRLTSHERREIVDYVTGTGLDMDWIFPTTAFEASRFKDRAGVAYRRAMPRLDHGGWRTRIRRGIDQLLGELEDSGPEEGRRLLAESLADSGKHIGAKTLDGLYDDLFAGETGRRGVDRMREEDVFEVFSEKRHGDAFLEVVERRVKGRMKGETDEPVTSDIKRLIRLPGSIHGKTGFEVVPMTRAELDGFDPFEDAVPAAYDEATVRVVCEGPVELRMRGKEYRLEEGANDVPAFVAVYLVCRKLALLDN